MTFEKAYNEWYDELLIYSINRGALLQEAEEIVNDAFLKLWEKKLGPDLWRQFLWTVVRYATIDIYRHKKFAPQVIFNDDETLVEDTNLVIESIVIVEILRSAELLPPTCRKIFFLYWKGLSTESIMAKLGLSRQNILNQKTRAIKLIKNMNKTPI